jgi:hypothetical protein
MSIEGQTALSAWAEDLLRNANKYEVSERYVYDGLMTAGAAVVPTPHQAILAFVAATHALAAVMLRSEYAYPVHAIDFATGLLSEALAFAEADRGAVWG